VYASERPSNPSADSPSAPAARAPEARADGAPAAADESRGFVDVQGRRWAVTEELAPTGEWNSSDEDTHRSGYPVGWLWFASDGMRKRLRLFPAGWRTLADAELERLCRRALVVR
jgi:hypothetical protein